MGENLKIMGRRYYGFMKEDGSVLTLGTVYESVLKWCNGEEDQADKWDALLSWVPFSCKTIADVKELFKRDKKLIELVMFLEKDIGLHRFFAGAY